MFDSNKIMALVKRMLATPAMQSFLETYNFFTSAFLSVVTVGLVTLIVFHIAKLSRVGDNPMERADTIRKLLVCAVCFATAGSIDIVYVFLLGIILG